MARIPYNNPTNGGMSWVNPISMAYSEEEQEPENLMIAGPHEPAYPSGLEICLTERELELLGLSDDCDVGDMLDLKCFAQVKSISKNAGDAGSSCQIRLQIIAIIAAENETTEEMGEME